MGEGGREGERWGESSALSPQGAPPLAGGGWLTSGPGKPMHWCPGPMVLAPQSPGGGKGRLETGSSPQGQSKRWGAFEGGCAKSGAPGWTKRCHLQVYRITGLW